MVTSGHVDRSDITSRAPRVAGKIAVLLKDGECAIQVYEEEKVNIHVQCVSCQFILSVIFDAWVSRELVRRRTQEAGEELRQIFEVLLTRVQPVDDIAFGEIILTDDAWDRLFGD